jgi:hypothetical protein
MPIHPSIGEALYNATNGLGSQSCIVNRIITLVVLAGASQTLLEFIIVFSESVIEKLCGALPEPFASGSSKRLQRMVELVWASSPECRAPADMSIVSNTKSIMWPLQQVSNPWTEHFSVIVGI